MEGLNAGHRDVSLPAAAAAALPVRGAAALQCISGGFAEKRRATEKKQEKALIVFEKPLQNRKGPDTYFFQVF